MNETYEDYEAEWKLSYEGWDPDEEPLREALCTVGNAHFATRGAAEEASADGVHYPGTYIAGGYNRLRTEVSGRVVENEDTVNWPNWLCLTFRVEEDDGAAGAWFRIEDVEVEEYRQILHLDEGVLERVMRFVDDRGRRTRLETRRLVHLRDAHLAAIEWTLTPENWSGRVSVRSGIDARVENTGVARYRELAGRHLEIEDTGAFMEGIDVAVRTRTSHIRAAVAARTLLYDDDGPLGASREIRHVSGDVAEVLGFQVREGHPVRVEKVVALYTSRGHAIHEPRHEARRAVRRATRFGRLLNLQRHAWRHLWRRCDLEFGDGRRSQLILRLHIFHLLQTVSQHSIDQDAGVPARGLHGEAYRGHIFWDELFIFPFLDLRIPEVTRALIMYRFRRLPEAREAAKAAGYRGAMYPWQSGSNGREETQELHLNPRSGRWIPDDSHRQRHVNAAIAYNVWSHFQATGDDQFLAYYGAEMILEIARFWSSIATWSDATGRYHIRGVMGPDEFHEGYPERGGGGVDDNAYTNVMAAWVIRSAFDVLEHLGETRRTELMELLELDDEELAHWDDVSRKLHVPFTEDGIIAQFDGWDDLEELDWEAYRERYDNIQRMDRILEAEGDTPNRYKLTKQADVLMLFYLLSSEELSGLFEHMGYRWDPEMIPRNVDYYCARTSHGSTLSLVVHSWVLTRSGREGSWEIFEKALQSDIDDIQGGTTPEGIHLGAMAGTVDIALRCYTGLEMRADALWFNPCLPAHMHYLKAGIRYRGQWLDFVVTHDVFSVSVSRGAAAPVRVGFRGEVHELSQGESRTWELPCTPPATQTAPEAP
ncbi:MAG: glycoside hydrolase family 65 protein [Myxococcota bacterium]